MGNLSKKINLGTEESLYLLRTLTVGKFERILAFDLNTGEIADLYNDVTKGQWIKADVRDMENLKSLLGQKQFNRLRDLILIAQGMVPPVVGYNWQSYFTVTNLDISTGNCNYAYTVKIIPLRLDVTGTPSLLVCCLSPTPFDKNTKDHATVVGGGGRCICHLSYDGQRWVQQDSCHISERELDVMSLTALGFSIPRIADKLCLSVSSINKTKQAFNKKMNCANAMEAIRMARTHGILH